MYLIINADDCGMSKTVDAHIRRCFEEQKISSTTIMAQMEDFEGAVSLYNDFHDNASFGWHVNLTEGKPLLYSQLLLDMGYYVEKEDGVVFNGKAFWRKRLSREMCEDIRKELIAQYHKISDSGIHISHLDSHHHIHTSPSMLAIIPYICRELKINKVRRIRNYVPFSMGFLLRQLWAIYYKGKIPGSKMTDFFGGVIEYIKSPGIKKGNVIELMCHPGHKGRYFEEEEELFRINLEDYDLQLINYNEL